MELLEIYFWRRKVGGTIGVVYPAVVVVLAKVNSFQLEIIVVRIVTSHVGR